MMRAALALLTQRSETILSGQKAKLNCRIKPAAIPEAYWAVLTANAAGYCCTTAREDRAARARV